MSFDVKNTTIRGFWDLICPYSCRGCGCVGEILCGCCKKYIIKQHKGVICPFCGRTLDKRCTDCSLCFESVYVGGRRAGLLGELISEYKYKSVRDICDVLVDVLDNVIPEDLENIILVPLPTIGKHVRARGFDHTLLLAKQLVKRRQGWRCETLLRRAIDTVQVGTKARDRLLQASKAYEVVGAIRTSAEYMLLDDVWTTGASMLSAAEILKEAGAAVVHGAVVATSKADGDVD